MSFAMARMAFVDGAAVRRETRGDTVDVTVLVVVNAGSEPEPNDEEEELLAIEERRERTFERTTPIRK